MARTKFRWNFPSKEEMHTLEVHDIDNVGLNGSTQLRNCLHGYNEQGVLRKVLYCSRDGRFYVRYADGWHKQMPNTNTVRRGLANRSAKGGGAFDTAIMRNYGHIRCYRLVAYAWCEHPQEAKTDPKWYKRYEVDHLNGNHADSNALNLQWVTPAENRRRAQIMRKLRKMAIDPKLVYTLNLKGIYRLEEAPLEYFMYRLPEVFAGDTAALSVEAINLDVAKTLDETRELRIKE